MFLLLTKTSFLNLILFIQILCGANLPHQSNHDGICGDNISSVLCVKDVLRTIGKSTRTINHMATAIEDLVIKKFPMLDTLYNSVNHSIRSMQSELPKSTFHEEFFLTNNIDKEFFVELMYESHQSIGILYNTIKNLLEKKDLYTSKVHGLFELIMENLRTHFICPYRSILDVYSHEYPRIDRLKSLVFNRRSQRDTISLERSSHSIILARLIRIWMDKIENVTNNIEMKLF